MMKQGIEWKGNDHINPSERIGIAEDNESHFFLSDTILKREYSIIRTRYGIEAIPKFKSHFNLPSLASHPYFYSRNPPKNQGFQNFIRNNLYNKDWRFVSCLLRYFYYIWDELF